jgi:phosphatidylinositol alpha-1,6-mannosyltransferase
VNVLGLEEMVEVAGFVSAERAAQFYSDADIFLHPQIAADAGRDFEGFGIAIADAMAAGCAVIVGEAGGAKELVEDEISGLIVDGSDTPAIAAALKRLLADERARRTLGQAGQHRSLELFTWQRHANAIIEASVVNG